MLEEGCEKNPPPFKLICSVLPPRFGVTLFYGTYSTAVLRNWIRNPGSDAFLTPGSGIRDG